MKAMRSDDGTTVTFTDIESPQLADIILQEGLMSHDLWMGVNKHADKHKRNKI